MTPETVTLYVPFATDTPWIVRREQGRVGTYASRDDAVHAARAVRAKLTRAWGFTHPPVQVQESDGSWHDIDDEPILGRWG